MRLPHEQYIRFLITTGLNHEETNEHLMGMELPGATVEYWEEQYDILHGTKLPKAIKTFWGLKNKKKLPEDFISYMNAVGLKDVWLWNLGSQQHFAIAVDAIKDRDVSITTRSLLALRVPSEEISALVNGKYAMNFPTASVDLLKTYFFNPMIMSRESWRGYLGLLPAHEKTLVYMGITGSNIELRAELGLPCKISVAEHYQKLHIFAMSKFDMYRGSADPSADALALKWANLAMSSGDKYEKLKIGDASDFGRDLQMEFDFIDTEFPLIGEDLLEEIQKDQEVEPDDTVSRPIPLENLED